MYDRNGLQLSQQANTLNSYRMTAVDMTTKKYVAVARAKQTTGKNQWTMFNIGLYTDPRDAAFVASEFEKRYTADQIRQMVTNGEFRDVATEFKESIEIPEWNFPAEGLLIEDILSDYSYKKNYVLDAKEALREVIQAFKLRPPTIDAIKDLVACVEQKYQAGKSYREAAKETMEII